MTYLSAAVSNDEVLAVSVNKAIAMSGLSRSTICNLVASKELQSVKVGGRRLIIRQSLVDLLHAENANSAGGRK